MKLQPKLLLLVLLFSSCIKEINFNVNDVPKQLVINSIFTVYESITVNVSGLQSILDTSFLFINNATVVIEEEGGDMDTLTNKNNGNYVSHLSGEPGKVYQLTVKADGYPTAFATDTIPIAVNIINATRKKSNTVDEYGLPHNDITVTFSKESKKTNYYELFFVEQWKMDSLFVVDFESADVSIDPIILASGTTDYNWTTFPFNDANINIGKYTIAMKMLRGSSSSCISKKRLLTNYDDANAAVLRTVSQAYYNYRNAWEKHKYYKNDSAKVKDWIYVPLIGEPQEMYSNIENGLGVFVAYNQDYFIYTEKE